MSRVYIETYGCQMNFADSEVMRAILIGSGHRIAESAEEADYVVINTCAIRDNAEQRVLRRIADLEAWRRKSGSRMRIGVAGCMAERLKHNLLQQGESVAFVVGPDSYRRLPSILQQVESGSKVAETELSTVETYDDIEPVRIDGNGVSAYISIMRGCQNFCTYCVVPYTRGRERSRDALTIVAEARHLYEQGYREVTLLGQNVNSYRAAETTFPQLLAMVAEVAPDLRVRYATSHPKDLSDDLLRTMASYDNICKAIHLPMQSGSDRMLKLMNRHYDSAWYMQRVDAIRRMLPGCSITTDIIAGFCTETDDDHRATLDMMRRVGFDHAFMFKFSLRPGTYAATHLVDDVPDKVKSSRLEEIIALQGELSLGNNRQEIGRRYEVLVEGESHRSKEQFFGRNSQNKVIVFDRKETRIGQYVTVEVTGCSAATLIGKLVNGRCLQVK
ncbi:MAG: tRNA (N6-isopentenyl adenosine(37)-C2)-methylthiotransferase MiaB [Bacteroidales bacterium]|nr:tRNA (N6-isopentenyl adenosine(37)-C2)-methylthiotransferase MiaB [Bacteroidales bacterium]